MTNLFVLEQHGPMERLVAESPMLYQFIAVNFANQIRCFYVNFDLKKGKILYLNGRNLSYYYYFFWVN